MYGCNICTMLVKKKSHYSVQIHVKEQVKLTTYLQTAVHSRYG